MSDVSDAEWEEPWGFGWGDCEDWDGGIGDGYTEKQLSDDDAVDASLEAWQAHLARQERPASMNSRSLQTTSCSNDSQMVGQTTRMKRGTILTL